MMRTIYVSIYASIDSESNVYRVRVASRKKYSMSAGAARACNFFAADAGASTPRSAKTGYSGVVNAF